MLQGGDHRLVDLGVRRDGGEGRARVHPRALSALGGGFYASPRRGADHALLCPGQGEPRVSPAGRCGGRDLAVELPDAAVQTAQSPGVGGGSRCSEAAGDTPITDGLLLARFLEEAGLPPGLLSVVVGAGSEIGDAIASRRLYSVSVDTLCDESASNETVAATIEDHGEKCASDGLETDAEGRVDATVYEPGAVLRRDLQGQWETVVHQPGRLFVDTLSLASDGHLYFTVDQIHR